MKCTIAHCEKDVFARGFCTHHYYANRKYGDPHKIVQKQHHGLTLSERFFRYVKKTDGCWRWLSYTDPQGYGRINYGGKPMLASRVSYLVHFGEIPEGMMVCHKCDNPSCVNPDHLFIGTQADNVADMERKGRARKVAVSGPDHHNAKLNEDAVREIRNSNGVSDIELGKRFNVSASSIYAVRTGKTWRHIK